MTHRWRSTLFGLSLEPRETVICRVHRQGKRIEVLEHLRAPIPAQAFKTDPERAGRELRACLQAAHIRSRGCVVCLPLIWAYSSELDLPDLSEADLENLIRLEAECRFPLAPDDLALTLTHRHLDDGARRGLLVGLPVEDLLNVGKALRAARLRSVSMTFAIGALADEHAHESCVLICAGRDSVDLAVVGANGSLNLRNLVWQEDASPETNPSDVREMTRQLRITLAQLPPVQRDRLRTAVLYGGERSDSFADLLAESLSGLGIALEQGVLTNPPFKGGPLSPALVASTAHALTLGRASIELNPKRKAHMPLVAARFSTRSVRWAVGVAAAAILALGAAFGLQGWQLARLERAWAEIGPRAEEAKALQDRVRKYRAWYDDSIPSLAILEKLALAFPGEGSVWVKTLQVKDRMVATCSGVASNRDAWMQVMDKLGKNKDLDDLQVVQARGDAPFSFTMTFRWKGKDTRGS